MTEQMLRDAAVRQLAEVEHRRAWELEGTPRSACGECGCRIFLAGPALTDGLCKPDRRNAVATYPLHRSRPLSSR
ncbi:hypothetical protein AB0D09_28345 [Streptomyces sp. NPDC049097]|uniref:hypothetical protein n=1 Tax=Streptomyces sp. NPDC049097 TaxID=3155497 RepID=UPI00341DAF6E